MHAPQVNVRAVNKAIAGVVYVIAFEYFESRDKQSSAPATRVAYCYEIFLGDCAEYGIFIKGCKRHKL